MKRRFLVLLLAVATLFSFSACKKEEVVEKEKSFHFGDIYLNTYENTYYGLSAEFEKDWIIYSEDEILETNDISLDEGITEEDVAVGDVLTDLVAYDAASYDSVKVYAEKIGADSSVDLEAKAEEYKTENSEYYASVEYTDIDASVSTREFVGEERTCVNISAKLDGDSVYFTNVYFECDEYLITIEVCSADEAGAEAILACFKAAE